MKGLLHTITNPQQRKYLKHMLAYLRLLIFWSSKPKTKFIVFTQSRCGSGLLATLLSNHSDILVDGEIFNSDQNFKVSSVRRYLGARSRGSIADKKDVYGFKLKLHHLTDHQGLSFDEAQTFISSLHTQGWKIIYLRRNNFFRRSLSSLAAQQRGIRHVHSKSDNLQKIHVNPDTLLNRIKVSEKRVELDQQALKGLPHLLIEYEKELLDQSKHSQTCNKIFEFLGIPAVEVETKLTRTSANDLSEIIENFDEVKSVMESSKYSDMLTSD